MKKNEGDALTEARLQQDCFMWFHNTYLQYRGLFFKINNESKSARDGMIGRATGIYPGVADTCFLIPNGMIIFIEFKTEKGIQSTKQAIWQATVVKFGYRYEIVRSQEEFIKLITSLI